jgi:hypothetical protein
VGLELGSIISELGGFPVKEAKFRREMEKLRNSRTVDLTLSKIERERNQLIVQVHTWDGCYNLKNIFAKNGQKNWCPEFYKTRIITLFFKKNVNFFAENCDHNIDHHKYEICYKKHFNKTFYVSLQYFTMPVL